MNEAEYRALLAKLRRLNSDSSGDRSGKRGEPAHGLRGRAAVAVVIRPGANRATTAE